MSTGSGPTLIGVTVMERAYCRRRGLAAWILDLAVSLEYGVLVRRHERRLNLQLTYTNIG